MIQMLNEILEIILRWMHNLLEIYSQSHEKMHYLQIALHYLTKAYCLLTCALRYTFIILWNKFREMFIKVIKRNAEIHWLFVYLFLMYALLLYLLSVHQIHRRNSLSTHSAMLSRFTGTISSHCIQVCF